MEMAVAKSGLMAREMDALFVFRDSSESKPVPPVTTVLPTVFWHFFLHQVLQGVLFLTLGSANKVLETFIS